MRVLPPTLILLWLFAYAAPSWVVLRFVVDRDRIVMEECVQRGVPLAERTCFGQCHLVKQLNDLKEKEQQGAPASASVKWDPEAISDDRPMMDPRTKDPVVDHALEGPSELLSGVRAVREGVPRG